MMQIGTLHGAAVPQRTAGAGTDIIVRILTDHWPKPSFDDGHPAIIDCMGPGCTFQSGYSVGDDAIWEEHARHIAELLEAAGIAETAGVAATERLRLADKLDEEATYRMSMPLQRETAPGWVQAANHLRHPTATN